MTEKKTLVMENKKCQIGMTTTPRTQIILANLVNYNYGHINFLDSILYNRCIYCSVSIETYLW